MKFKLLSHKLSSLTNIMKEITNMMLLNEEYDMEILKHNINKLDLFTVMNTQILTAKFCIDVILNEEYQITSEEKTIDIYDILNRQPHIKKEDLIKLK